MKPKIKAIQTVAEVPAGSMLATVLNTQDGEALHVTLDDNNAADIRVVGHASEVPPLQPGDRVVILNTRDGAIVTHRLRSTGERPTTGFKVNKDGSLSVRTADGITLATDHATIELRADGRIFIDGQEIYSEAKGLQTVLGRPLKLN
jgi:hypothetical protein